LAKEPSTPPFLQERDRVQIHSFGYPPYCGIVEDSQLAFDVVWIRDLGTGARRMLSIADHLFNRM
jgi:hypothetical protein